MNLIGRCDLALGLLYALETHGIIGLYPSNAGIKETGWLVVFESWLFHIYFCDISLMFLSVSGNWLK